MKTNYIKTLIFTSFFALVLISCVQNENYTKPNLEVKTYELITNKTVEVLNAAVTSATPVKVLTEDIIEAYVTSSDEAGNFFSSISFQTKPTALQPNPVGFSVAVDLKAFNNGFVPGRKVYIKLKDLYVAKVDGSLKIGSLFEDTSVGRISKFDWDKYLFPSNIILAESELLRTLTLAQASTNENINTLVEINNVQFTDASLSRTLYDIDSGGFATNHNIVDVNGGTNRFLRISSFSTLAGENVPSGRGKIRGIMSKFGQDFQFIVRFLTDFKLSQTRDYIYSSNFTESFNGFNAATGNYLIKTSYISFPNYYNSAVVGTKNWFIRDNSYLEMSAFAGTVEDNLCYFMIPVDMTAAKTFKFSCEIKNFTNGIPLKIYRTNNFVPGMKIKEATLFDITSSFALPVFNAAMASVGTYNIPENFQGNGFFVFEYKGTSFSDSPAKTTGVFIDNVQVNSI